MIECLGVLQVFAQTSGGAKNVRFISAEGDPGLPDENVAATVDTQVIPLGSSLRILVTAHIASSASGPYPTNAAAEQNIDFVGTAFYTEQFLDGTKTPPEWTTSSYGSISVTRSACLHAPNGTVVKKGGVTGDSDDATTMNGKTLSVSIGGASFGATSAATCVVSYDGTTVNAQLEVVAEAVTP